MGRQIGLEGIEPSSHRYKQWALTNRRQSLVGKRVGINTCRPPGAKNCRKNFSGFFGIKKSFS